VIPEAKQSAVERALREAFDAQGIEDIQPLTGGLSSALVYRIVVDGRPYLLRVGGVAAGDPSHQFACMKLGGDAGIAPRIWYASVEDWLLISDFVEPKPFPEHAATMLATTIRQLHGLPRFPRPQANSYFASMDGFVQRFQAANVLPERATDDLFRMYAEIAKVYPRDESDWVASHNDLKPQNILYDGQQFKFVDWEAAFLNDRYVDLSVVANFFVNDEAAEAAFLEAYFGEPAGEYRHARFYLMRQSIHVFYAALMLPLAARAGAAIDPDARVPDFREFHRLLTTGAISLEDWDSRVQYALVHLYQALTNMNTTRFKDSIALVGARP